LPNGGTVKATYVAYYLDVENPYMAGTMGAGCPIYGAPLTAREDYTGPQDGDSCHVTLKLMHPFANQISKAMQTLGDPGVMADMARYRRVAKRRAELRMQEHNLDRRWA
jgi:hypothetical protein